MDNSVLNSCDVDDLFSLVSVTGTPPVRRCLSGGQLPSTCHRPSLTQCTRRASAFRNPRLLASPQPTGIPLLLSGHACPVVPQSLLASLTQAALCWLPAGEPRPPTGAHAPRFAPFQDRRPLPPGAFKNRDEVATQEGSTYAWLYAVYRDWFMRLACTGPEAQQLTDGWCEPVAGPSTLCIQSPTLRITPPGPAA
jgi:hypothetical protein